MKCSALKQIGSHDWVRNHETGVIYCWDCKKKMIIIYDDDNLPI